MLGVSTIFTSGLENVHGVEPVRTAGRRVVLASWFTTDQQYDHSDTQTYKLESVEEEAAQQQAESDTDVVTVDVVAEQHKPAQYVCLNMMNCNLTRKKMTIILLDNFLI